MRCEDIQALLMDYHCRELGAARAEFVREHLRFCIHCQKASAEILETLDMIRKADGSLKPPDRLTDARRGRIWWALTHPIRRWIEKHHVAVSWTATILVLAIVLSLLMRIQVVKDIFMESWYEVSVGVQVGQPSGPAQGPAPSGAETGREEKK